MSSNSVGSASFESTELATTQPSKVTPTREEALRYINRVREEFISRPDLYKGFLSIM